MSRRLHVEGIRNAVIVAPHPDDETIAAFGVMSRLKLAGARVRVIVVTNGAASHPASKNWSPSRLCSRRKKETIAAMRLLGLTRADVKFLDFEDATLPHLSPAGRTRLAQKLSAGPLPDLVIRPAAEDSHPDHHVVGVVCKKAWPSSVCQLSYSVWPGVRSPASRFNFPLGTERLRKWAALRLYRTQTGMIKDDPQGFCISRHQMQRFASSSEKFS